MKKAIAQVQGHSFRLRCQVSLLKRERRTASEIADLLGCCEVVVNNWLKRYEAEGTEGLHTKPGRGRKPVLDAEKHLPGVQAAVAANRQRIRVAKAELRAELGKTFSTRTLARYKRIRQRPAKEPCPEVYELKAECLGELEQLSRLKLINLYYGDESRVSLDPCVPYGWQFVGEEVFMPAAKGAGLNCFALLTKGNDLLFETTRGRITSQFSIEQLERLSFSIRKLTVVVLDNARVHTSQQVQERRPVWQRRGLFIFNLPP